MLKDTLIFQINVDTLCTTLYRPIKYTTKYYVASNLYVLLHWYEEYTTMCFTYYCAIYYLLYTVFYIVHILYNVLRINYYIIMYLQCSTKYCTT